MKKLHAINFLFTVLVIAFLTASCNNAKTKGIDLYNQGVKFYKNMDYSNAFRSFQKAADLGNADGTSVLALMYESGKGVAINYQKAMQLYLKAAQDGHAGAMNNIGVMYEKGLGVVQNNLEAIDWYKKAVNAGNADAVDNLAAIREKMR